MFNKQLNIILGGFPPEFIARVRASLADHGHRTHTAVDEIQDLWRSEAECDAAVFVLGRAEQTPGGKLRAMRETVAAQAAALTAILGTNRVLLAYDWGVEPLACFPPASSIIVAKNSGKESSVEVLVQSSLERLADMNSVAHECAKYDDHGLHSQFLHELQELEHNMRTLGAFISSGQQHAEPFVLRSERGCIAAYCKALERVERRFLTTTYLSSGFWTEGTSSILKANAAATRRIVQNGGSVQRLLFLEHPPKQEIAWWHDEYLRLRKYHDHNGCRNLRQKFVRLCDTMHSLAADGCHIRIVHADQIEGVQPPWRTSRESYDAELAVYDDWRVDVFWIAHRQVITSLESYTPVFDGFSELRENAVAYFNSLWNQGSSLDTFLDKLTDSFENAGTRIDYAPTWLARYDFDLPPEDESLKIVELSRVCEILRTTGNWGTIRNYLDIGTCTARYPLNLRQAMRGDGYIIGLDNDIDSVRFARSRIEQTAGATDRIRIELGDFCDTELRFDTNFDLITCMLGTMCHFGMQRHKEPPYRDTLQGALERLNSLLEYGGLLFFTVWSEEACRQQRLLSIYTNDEVDRVIDWTPTRTEMAERLRLAGLHFEGPYRLEERLDLYHCWCESRADAAGSSAVGQGTM